VLVMIQGLSMAIRALLVLARAEKVNG